MKCFRLFLILMQPSCKHIDTFDIFVTNTWFR